MASSSNCCDDAFPATPRAAARKARLSRPVVVLLERAIAIKAFAAGQPSSISPTRSATGVRTSSKKTSFVSCSPLMNSIGRIRIPGRFISTSRKTSPPRPVLPGLDRASRNMWVAYWAKLVQTLVPFNTNSSPSRVARRASALKSDPAWGSEKPWHHSCSPFRMAGR